MREQSVNQDFENNSMEVVIEALGKHSPMDSTHDCAT